MMPVSDKKAVQQLSAYLMAGFVIPRTQSTIIFLFIGQIRASEDRSR